MEDFDFDQTTLDGTLITMTFGTAGRITQMWAARSETDGTEEFQFAGAPVPMGDEVSSDYLPGTILIGARTDPEEPWILGRNSSAVAVSNDGEDGTSSVSFEYQMGLLEEIRILGKFYEVRNTVPEIVWEIELSNRSRRSVEIGELAFPFLLNDCYVSFADGPDEIDEARKDRVINHSFIGGAASYLYSRRLVKEQPGLLIYPGAETSWEFGCSVPGSLTTTYEWGGIPVVYLYSRAVMEREGWAVDEIAHNSLILEPGDKRIFQTRFAVVDSHHMENPNSVLAAVNRPVMRLLPGAVAPVDVGIAIEVAGTTPTQFYSDVEADLETDADEEGGFCYIKPHQPGPLTLKFKDTQDRQSEAHLMFIPPIFDLIKARANSIATLQFTSDSELPYPGIVLPMDNRTGQRMTDPEVFHGFFAVDAILADIFFLAEKNARFPDKAEMDVLDECLSWLEEHIINPSNFAVGAVVPDPGSAAVHYGRVRNYFACALILGAMGRMYRVLGDNEAADECHLEAEEILSHAAKLLDAPLEHNCFLGVEMELEPLENDSLLLKDVRPQLDPYLPDEYFTLERRAKWDPNNPKTGNLDWFSAYADNTTPLERLFENEMHDAFETLFAHRLSAPQWWQYGSDIRTPMPENWDHPVYSDSGRVTLGVSNVLNSATYLQSLEKDRWKYDENRLRLAFGGMISPWGLVNKDGTAAAGYGADKASKHFGPIWTSGDLGFNLAIYLRRSQSLVIPAKGSGILSFGCHFSSLQIEGEEFYQVIPWDGVGGKIRIAQIGFTAKLSFGTFKEVRLRTDKKSVVLTVENPSKYEGDAYFEIEGLWGIELDPIDKQMPILKNGVFYFKVQLKPEATREIIVNVTI